MNGSGGGYLLFGGACMVQSFGIVGKVNERKKAYPYLHLQLAPNTKIMPY